MRKNYFLLIILLFLAGTLRAQTSTEQFETESPSSTSFTDNGVIFNILSHVSTYRIQASFPNTGWNGSSADNRFIDNTPSTVANPSFSIKTTSNLFKVSRFWVYVASAGGQQNVAGTLNITGKLSGITKFTQTKTTGFTTSVAVANGYTLIDLTNLNGQNYSNLVLDQLQITAGGNFQYLCLDAFTWVKDVGTIPPVCNLTSTGSKTEVLCNGSATGTATLTPVGGTAPFTYAWTNSASTTNTATGLTAGSYAVTVTDSKGCTSTQNFTIFQPAALSATTSQTDATCTVSGEATVTPSGGTAPYTYLWSPGGETTQTVTGLAGGTYSCVITDANGCTTTKNFTINTTNTLVATTSKTDVSCNGGNTGSATVIPSGAPGPYTYSWAPSGGTNATATGLTAGNYSVTITASNGCSIVKSFIITQPAALAVTPSQTNVACNGASTGTAEVTVTGGTGPYSYNWSPSGGTAAAATGLSAGTYTVTIEDANLCQTTQNFTITEPTALSATFVSTNLSCSDGSNGSATVTASGGTGTYTYSWSPRGGTAATATGLTAGTYTVSITDANNCLLTEQVTITAPAAIVANITSQTDVACNGTSTGSATLSVTGGTGPYTYAWSPFGGTAATATGLSAGRYTVTITDANNCSTTKPVIIDQPATALSAITSKVDVSTNGASTGAATVSPSGGTPGYTYAWLPSGGNGPTASNLAAGSYTVTVTDAYGCITTESVQILQPPALTDFEALTKVYGSAAFTLTEPTSASSGNFSYTSSNTAVATISGNTVTILKPGTTTITATQAASGNYSSGTTTAVLTIDPKPIAVSLNASPLITKVFDGNASVTLAPTNYALTGVESGDAVTVSSTATFDSKDTGNGKTVTAGTFVLNGAQKDNYVLSNATATAAGNITPRPLTLTMSASPAITKVYNGNNTATLAAGNYVLGNLVPGDEIGVTGTAVYNNSNAGMDKPITITGISLVNTTNYTLAATTAASTGTITQKPLTVTADNKERFVGELNPPLTVSYNGFIPGESNAVLTIQPSINTTANINSPIGNYDIFARGTSAANYAITHVNGTMKVKSGAPSNITLATVTLYENRAAGTAAGTLTSTSDDPSATFTYTLAPGTGDTDNSLFAISGSSINTAASLDYENKSSYSIRVKSTTQYGLSLEKVFTISLTDVNEMPTMNAVTIAPICYTSNQQTVNLTGITPGPEAAQTTTLTVSSDNAALFSNLAVEKNGTNAGTLTYTPAEGASGTATVTVMVKDDGGMADGGVDTYTTTFTIAINALPVVAISSDKDLTVSKGETLQLTASGGTSYSWANANGIIGAQNSAALTVRPPATTTYTVTVTNASGCTEVKDITIVVMEDYAKIKGTNIMTPNGDGVNDFWIVENLDLYPNNQVDIYDRGGRSVFTKKIYDNSWDATFNGAPLEEGTYYYIISFGATRSTVKGFISILREK